MVKLKLREKKFIYSSYSDRFWPSIEFALTSYTGTDFVVIYASCVSYN